MKNIDWQYPVNWDAPLNRGLISWWMAGQSSPYWGGPLFRDLCNRNNGTLVTSPTWGNAIGRRGAYGTLTFSGSNHVNCGSSTTLNPTEAITVSAWIRPTVNTNQIIFSREDVDSGERCYTLDDFSGTPRFFGGGGGTFLVTGASTLPQNSWTHLVGTYDRVNCKIYFNGKEDGTSTGTTAIPSYTVNNLIGAWHRFGVGNPSQFFTGSIDDIRVYNRSLSASEACNLYHASCRGYAQELNYYRRKRTSTFILAQTPGISNFSLFDSPVFS